MGHHTGQHREDELPEHETRPERDTGGGMTTFGVSAEQRGPVNEEVVEEEHREEDPLTAEDALGYDRDR